MKAESTIKLPEIFDAIAKRGAGQSSRYEVDKPFLWSDGYTYATDGRVAVRTNSIQADLEANPKAPDPTTQPWEKDAYSSTPITLPPAASPDMFTRQCETCMGEGVVTRDACSSRTPCTVCDSKGTIEKPVDVQIAGCKHGIGQVYINLLRKHGVEQVYAPADGTAPFYFRAGDFEGLVMPCMVEATDD